MGNALAAGLLQFLVLNEFELSRSKKARRSKPRTWRKVVIGKGSFAHENKIDGNRDASQLITSGADRRRQEPDYHRHAAHLHFLNNHSQCW